MKRFYLGMWSAAATMLSQGSPEIPRFASHQYLKKRVTPYPKERRAVAHWALDSGAYSMKKGEEFEGVRKYGEAIQRYHEELGNLEWAAPQDFLCAPKRLADSGMTVKEAQARTLANYLALKTLPLAVPIIPVLQGWAVKDYLVHAAQYESAGVKLTDEPVVGVGSMGRRSWDLDVLKELVEQRGMRVHCFGASFPLMESGLLYSADSTRWSFDTRKEALRRIKLGLDPNVPTMPGCTHRSDCSVCINFAQAWYVIKVAGLLR